MWTEKKAITITFKSKYSVTDPTETGIALKSSRKINRSQEIIVHPSKSTAYEKKVH